MDVSLSEVANAECQKIIEKPQVFTDFGSARVLWKECKGVNELSKHEGEARFTWMMYALRGLGVPLEALEVFWSVLGVLEASLKCLETIPKMQ